MAQHNSFVVRDVRIFTGLEIIEEGYVHVEDGRIIKVSSGIPPKEVQTGGLRVLSKPGHTLLPGLIDAHVHAHGGDVNAVEQPIRFGVTTVMDLFNQQPYISDLRKITSDPSYYGKYADFKTSGLALTIRGGWPEAVVTAHDKSEETREKIEQWPNVKTEEDAETAVKQAVADGAEYIKLMHESGASLKFRINVPPLNLQRAGIKAAHAHGLRAVAHALSYRDTLDMLECGIDGMTHTFVDKPSDDSYVQKYLETGAHLNPTLATIGSLTGEGRALQHRFAQHPLAKRLLMVPPGDTMLCQCLSMANEDARVEYAFESVRRLRAAGVPIIVGSDAAAPAVGTAYGLSLHHEMWLFIKECGFKPLEALRAATSLIVERFGFEDRGLIQTGRRADLLLVDGDIEEVMAATSDELIMPIRGVWRNGVVADVWRDVMAA